MAACTLATGDIFDDESQEHFGVDPPLALPRNRNGAASGDFLGFLKLEEVEKYERQN